MATDSDCRLDISTVWSLIPTLMLLILMSVFTPWSYLWQTIPTLSTFEPWRFPDTKSRHVCAMFGPTTQGYHGPVSSTLIKFVSLDFSQLILNDTYLGSSEKFSSRFLIFRLEWHCAIPCTPGWRTVGVNLHLKMLEHMQSRINCCKFGVSGSGFSSVIVSPGEECRRSFKWILSLMFIYWLVGCLLFDVPLRNIAVTSP